jgi:hypothetical protein
VCGSNNRYNEEIDCESLIHYACSIERVPSAILQLASCKARIDSM